MICSISVVIKSSKVLANAFFLMMSTLDTIDVLFLVYSNSWSQNIIFEVRNGSFRNSNTIIISFLQNMREVSIKHLSYSVAIKIDTFEQKISMCNKPEFINLNNFKEG